MEWTDDSAQVSLSENPTWVDLNYSDFTVFVKVGDLFQVASSASETTMLKVKYINGET